MQDNQNQKPKVGDSTTSILDGELLPETLEALKEDLSPPEIEYDDITIRVRKDDKVVMLNNYLGLIITNLEEGNQACVMPISEALLGRNPYRVKKALNAWRALLEETLHGVEQLDELVDEVLTVDSPIFAKIKVKPGQPYRSEDINRMIKKSQEEVKKTKDKAIKRKAAKAKKASSKKASNK